MKKLLIYLIPIALLFISGCQELDTLVRSTSPNPVQQKKGLYVEPVNKPTTVSTQAQAQIALVIGNGNYEYKPLSNTINDAEDMARVLKKIGFDVTLKTNLKQTQMNRVISQFSQRLSQRQAVGLFYFSGHGAQVNGKNYLLPIDNNKIQDQYDLESYAIHADQLVKRMEAASKLNIIILDACRDNPYRSVGKSIGRGLARMEGVSGSFIAFATSIGTTASDVSSNPRNGLFTGHLVKALEKAVRTHPRIEDLFIEVTNAVTEESGGRQEPWTSSSLKGKYCFGGCLSSPATVTSPSNQNANKLLAVCNRHFQAGRLSGGDGTAFACYQKVLKTDPTNAQALAGLDKIEARYVALAKQAIQNKQLKKAGQYLANLRQIIPASSKLGNLERQLASLQARQSYTPKAKIQPPPPPVYRVSYGNKGKTAKIVNEGNLYSTINRTNCLSWPSEQVKQLSGKDGWGSFYPKNGDVGTIVAEMTHCNSGKKIYLLKIGKYYAPLSYDGVQIISGSQTSSTTYYPTPSRTSFGAQNHLFQLGEWLFFYPSGNNDVYLWHTSKNIALEIVGDSNGWWHLALKKYGEMTIYSNGSQAKSYFYNRPWRRKFTQPPTIVKPGSKFILSGSNGQTNFFVSYGITITLSDRGVIEILPFEPTVSFKNARSAKTLIFSGK